MEKRNKWIDLSLLGLSFVGLSGLLLRSKIVFSMPFINYNHLIEAHSHFTFGGWITVALFTLMVYDLLPLKLHKNRIYQWLLGGIAASAWAMFVAYLMKGYSISSILCSFVFIAMTLVFSIYFVKDALKSNLPKPTLILAIASLICLVLSSSGTIIIAYIFFTKSFDAFLYRDSLFTYLHFQYNGFFSLAIFSLLSKVVYNYLDPIACKKLNRFVVILCISVLPSLFISYLWQDPKLIFWIIAIVEIPVILTT